MSDHITQNVHNIIEILYTQPLTIKQDSDYVTSIKKSKLPFDILQRNILHSILNISRNIHIKFNVLVNGNPAISDGKETGITPTTHPF